MNKTSVWTKIFAVILLVLILLSIGGLIQYFLAHRKSSSLEIFYIVNVAFLILAGILFFAGSLRSSLLQKNMLMAVGCFLSGAAAFMGITTSIMESFGSGFFALSGSYPLIIYILIDTLYLITQVSLGCYFMEKLPKIIALISGMIGLVVNVVYLASVFSYVATEGIMTALVYPASNLLVFVCSLFVLLYVSLSKQTARESV